MNRQQAKELAALIQAFIDGKQIECRRLGSYAGWYNTSDPSFNLSDYQYRVKVEPRTFYALEWTGNLGQLFGLSTTREKAEGYRKGYARLEEVKIIELVEKV